jgi:hypothetical protein
VILLPERADSRAADMCGRPLAIIDVRDKDVCNHSC